MAAGRLRPVTGASTGRALVPFTRLRCRLIHARVAREKRSHDGTASSWLCSATKFSLIFRQFRSGASTLSNHRRGIPALHTISLTERHATTPPKPPVVVVRYHPLANSYPNFLPNGRLPRHPPFQPYKSIFPPPLPPPLPPLLLSKGSGTRLANESPNLVAILFHTRTSHAH